MKCPGRKNTKNLPELAKDFSLTSEVFDYTKNETSIMKVITKLGPEVLKKSCSTQLSMNVFLLINVKMPTIVGILTFMARKHSILRLSEPEKC